MFEYFNIIYSKGHNFKVLGAVVVGTSEGFIKAFVCEMGPKE